MNKTNCINWNEPVFLGLSCAAIQKAGVTMECEGCPSFKEKENE